MKLWTSEHGAEYDVPEEIESALPDISWHNNLCPSFGTERVELFVDHPNVDMRETPGPRYYVNRDGETVLETDSMKDALELALVLIEHNEDLKQNGYTDEV